MKSKKTWQSFWAASPKTPNFKGGNLDDKSLVYWLLGALFALVVLMARYILGRFSALESSVAKNQSEFIRHRDLERYMKPLEKQIDQMNARMDQLLELQMELLKNRKGDK